MGDLPPRLESDEFDGYLEFVRQKIVVGNLPQETLEIDFTNLKNTIDDYVNWGDIDAEDSFSHRNNVLLTRLLKCGDLLSLVVPSIEDKELVLTGVDSMMQLYEDFLGWDLNTINLLYPRGIHYSNMLLYSLLDVMKDVGNIYYSNCFKKIMNLQLQQDIFEERLLDDWFAIIYNEVHTLIARGQLDKTLDILEEVSLQYKECYSAFGTEFTGTSLEAIRFVSFTASANLMLTNIFRFYSGHDTIRKFFYDRAKSMENSDRVRLFRCITSIMN